MTTTYAPTTQKVCIPNWTVGRVLAVWATAALPMGILAWVVAPLLAQTLSGPAPLAEAVTLCLTTGLIWQFVVVVAILRREQGSLSWAAAKDALWLHAPSQPRTGRRGGVLWLILVPCMLLFGAEEFVPELPPVADHDLLTFLNSAAGSSVVAGGWGWFAVIAVLVIFNTVLGEELLFRGLLLPRMRGAFGRWDWVANGVLFALYHLHMPWAIPTVLIDTVAISYPARRYRSALIGIIVHSAQSVVVLALTLSVVLH
jgi:uncharacterized protein